MKTNAALREQALALSPVERAGLIEDLLASFDEKARANIDEAWAREAEERIDAFDKSEIGAVSLVESKKRISAK